MSHDGASNGLSRRDLLKTGALAAGAAAVLPTRPAGAQLKTVARNRTLSLVWIGSREGRWVDFELWNPYAIGVEPPERPGHPLRAAGLLQRLRRQGASLAGRELPVQPGLQGADDQDPLRDHLERRQALLGRGRRLHAHQPPRPGPEGPLGRRRPAVRRRRRSATDANTVVIKFKVPAPRFFFFMTYKYDIGVYIVPKHIFEGQDWTTFKHFDVAKGWPVTTGPWKVVVRLARAEGHRPPRRVVGGQGGPGADAQGRAHHLAPQRDRAADRPAAHLEPDRLLGLACSRRPSRRSSARTRRSPPTPGRSRPTATSTGGRSRSTSTTSARRSTTRTCAGRSATSSTASRSSTSATWAASHRRRRCRCPSYPALKPYIDGGQGPPREAQHARVQPREGRGAAGEEGLEEGRPGIWVDAKGQPAQARHHRLRVERARDRPACSSSC